MEVVNLMRVAESIIIDRISQSIIFSGHETSNCCRGLFLFGWGGRIIFKLSLTQESADSNDFSQLAANMEKLTAIRNGDHATFVEVYDVMHARVFRFFLKRVYFHDTAKDLTQQCFIRLWQYRESLSPEHALEKQIFIIARGLLINHLKKEATQKKLKADASRRLSAVVETGGDTLLERSDEVNEAIKGLSPVRKRVIILKTFHGCTNKEIAQQLQISVKTVEDHVTKAFRHIRQIIAFFLF
jgi:RNA polymerase sigma factor (sigma-70 family)